MSGRKNDDLDLEGVDWDQALAEWEEKTFLPEAAKDRETQQPATLQGTPLPPSAIPPSATPAAPATAAPLASASASASAPASASPSASASAPASAAGPMAPSIPEHVPTKPLYMPPAKSSASTRPPPPSSTRSPMSQRLTLDRGPEVPPSMPRAHVHEDEEEEESNATVIAAIPRELLRRGADGAPRSGGGLGQMFAKTDRPSGTDLENAPTVSSGTEKSERAGATTLKTAPPPSSGALEDPSVVTSAKALHGLASAASPRSETPRPRAASLPPEPTSDPFAEPDPFRAEAGDDGVATVSSIEETSDDVEALLRAAHDEDDDEVAVDVKLSDAPPDLASAGGAGDSDRAPPENLATTAKAAAAANEGPPLHHPDRRVFDADTETSAHLRGAIHAPSKREHDPNEETSVLSRAALRVSFPEESDEEDEPTRFGRGAVKATQSWVDEREARDRLTDEARAAFVARAEWLEVEGRAADDRVAKARTLLAASELRAILGEADLAEMLAREAAASAPTMAMASRQARALAPHPRDPAAFAEALDASARQSPTKAGALHDLLLAADVLRSAGDKEGAAKRWDRAIRTAPSDPRAPLARAADRLGDGDLQHPMLRMPDTIELAPIAEGFARALAIRGVTRPDVATDEKLPGDALRRMREALDAGDLARAAAAAADLARVTELRDAASWLSASLGAASSAGRADSVDALRVLAKRPAARRMLAARAIELGAPDIVEEALGKGAEREALAALDRAVLGFFAGGVDAAGLDAVASNAQDAPLAAAIAGASRQASRADLTAGGARSRALVRLARLVASDADARAVEDALDALAGEHDGETRALALEMADRGGQAGEVSDAILAWAGDTPGAADAGDRLTNGRDRSLAAGLIAERAGDAARAAAAYASALALDETCEAALRALPASDADAIVAKLRAMGDARWQDVNEGDAASRVAAAAAYLEAATRAGGRSGVPAARAELLDAAHAAAPWLPVASFLGERDARRANDAASVLHWIGARREGRAAPRDDAAPRDGAAHHAPAGDPIEEALDAVREALLLADADPARAAAKLAEAHRARPDDVALRELLERVSPTPLADRAAWREARAKTSTSPATKARLLLEAVHEHERAGDAPAALRDAQAAHAAATGGPSDAPAGTARAPLGAEAGLARLALERAELQAGAAARLADELLSVARSSPDARERREAYERLADLDATGRGDAASALLWHKTILEENPEHLPSLRHVEHALLGDGRIEELEPVAARVAAILARQGAATPGGGGETTAHAHLAARLRARGPMGDVDAARPLVELAASLASPSLWALRSLASHARASEDDAALARASLALADRTTRAHEIAALVVRAAEAAMRDDDLPRARELLERAATEDPGDVVTWGLLTDVRQRSGDSRAAAEACENLARASVVDLHRLLAWYDAGRLWLDDVGDEDRAMAALEEAASLDASFLDVFARLSVLYTQRGRRHDLAALLERRILACTDDDDRVRLEVDRATALVAVGELSEARRALEDALSLRPDDVGALNALADLCARPEIGDWGAAERAWVRLARLATDVETQRAVYRRLGDLYASRLDNLPRAEVALGEVLKRAPEDRSTMERLVDVYKRQGDAPRALDTAQQLLKLAHEPAERRRRLVDIASIHENVTKELRKAEQALEAARREFPNDVGALRALAEFYQRQRQMPAMNILLDRASADARRALSGGRFSPALFETLQMVFELRGKRDAARVVAASLGAMTAAPVTEATRVQGAGGRGGDPRLDDLLAPEALGPGLRALLLRAGDALDGASALDLRALSATPLGTGAAQSRVAAIATSLGIPPVQVLVSPGLGRTCVPNASSTPSIVVGEPLLDVLGEPAAAFALTRALKLVQAHASSLVRTPPRDLAVLVAAWLSALNPSWRPEGIAEKALADATRRVNRGLSGKTLLPETATIALEVAGTLGPHLASLGSSTIAWADRVALLAVGDPNAALDAIAWSLGSNEGAPRDAASRAQWVLRAGEARDLLVFSTSDAFAEARAKAGVAG